MRREDVCGRVIAAPFTWTSVSACALSDRRYIALLCSYTFSVLLLHRCVLFVFPLSLYHSKRTSTPRVCMSISVGNRTDGIFLFCIETHRSVLFVVTPSSCCPYNVQSERLLQLSAGGCIFRESINEDADGTFQLVLFSYRSGLFVVPSPLSRSQGTSTPHVCLCVHFLGQA